MSKYDKGGAFGDGPGSPSDQLKNRQNKKVTSLSSLPSDQRKEWNQEKMGTYSP